MPVYLSKIHAYTSVRICTYIPQYILQYFVCISSSISVRIFVCISSSISDRISAVFQSNIHAYTTCIFILFLAQLYSTHACNRVSIFTLMPRHCGASKHRQIVAAQSEWSSAAAAAAAGAGAGAGPGAAAAAGAPLGGNSGASSSPSPPIRASRSTTPSADSTKCAASLSAGIRLRYSIQDSKKSSTLSMATLRECVANACPG